MIDVGCAPRAFRAEVISKPGRLNDWSAHLLRVRLRVRVRVRVRVRAEARVVVRVRSGLG